MSEGKECRSYIKRFVWYKLYDSTILTVQNTYSYKLDVQIFVWCKFWKFFLISYLKRLTNENVIHLNLSMVPEQSVHYNQVPAI